MNKHSQVHNRKEVSARSNSDPTIVQLSRQTNDDSARQDEIVAVPSKNNEIMNQYFCDLQARGGRLDSGSSETMMIPESSSKQSTNDKVEKINEHNLQLDHSCVFEEVNTDAEPEMRSSTPSSMIPSNNQVLYNVDKEVDNKDESSRASKTVGLVFNRQVREKSKPKKFMDYILLATGDPTSYEEA